MKSIRTTILVVICITLTLTSYSQKTFKSAVEFNDYIASINDTLYRGGQEWGRKLNTVIKSKSFDSLGTYRMNMESFITRKKLELKSLPDFKGSKEFVDVMITFLTYEARLMREGFAPLEDLNEKSTKEEIDAALKKLISLSGEEKALLATVTAAQQKYAASNGFTIEEED